MFWTRTFCCAIQYWVVCNNYWCLCGPGGGTGRAGGHHSLPASAPHSHDIARATTNRTSKLKQTRRRKPNKFDINYSTFNITSNKSNKSNKSKVWETTTCRQAINLTREHIGWSKLGRLVTWCLASVKRILTCVCLCRWQQTNSEEDIGLIALQIQTET